MQVHRSLETISYPDSWLTIGIFDGVHLGHQAILRQLVSGAHARGVPAVVLTFDPHPMTVLTPGRQLEMLSNISERADMLEKLGIDALIAHPFTTEIAALPAESFLQQIKNAIRFTRFWVGHDFAMGRNREGNIPRLRVLGESLGYTLDVVGPLQETGSPVSSSRIRASLRAGEVEAAAAMLGRPYTLSGEVVLGAQRGRTIGVPTANIAVPPTRLVPAPGVYACRVTHDGHSYAAATNIGVRPTFEEGAVPISIEAHLLDFSEDIYGQTLEAAFHRRLRGEMKFDSIDALVEQIRADIRRTEEVFHETLS